MNSEYPRKLTRNDILRVLGCSLLGLVLVYVKLKANNSYNELPFSTIVGYWFAATFGLFLSLIAVNKIQTSRRISKHGIMCEAEIIKIDQPETQEDMQVSIATVKYAEPNGIEHIEQCVLGYNLKAADYHGQSVKIKYLPATPSYPYIDDGRELFKGIMYLFFGLITLLAILFSNTE